MPMIIRFISCNFSIWFLSILTLFMVYPQSSSAHFKYSDPRIIHIAANDNGDARLLMRMPAALIMLPDGWYDTDDEAFPPYSIMADDKIFFDKISFDNDEETIKKRLLSSLTITTGDKKAELNIANYSIYPNDKRPNFGTLKTAKNSFNRIYNPDYLTRSEYFDLTFDVKFIFSNINISDGIYIKSNLGENLRKIKKLGTIIKFYRNDQIETRASMGLIDISFENNQSQWQKLLDISSIGAAHIYGGFDHLLLILLIAIAAQRWKNALILSLSFTTGHMLTLTVGLYGIIPASIWFIPAIELAIALSIIIAAMSILMQLKMRFDWLGIFFIGLIHGFGFASSASEVLFSGSINPIEIIAFTIGLEICQMAVYAVVLPVIFLLNNRPSLSRFYWKIFIILAIIFLASIWSVDRIIMMASILTN